MPEKIAEDKKTAKNRVNYKVSNGSFGRIRFLHFEKYHIKKRKNGHSDHAFTGPMMAGNDGKKTF